MTVDIDSYFAGGVRSFRRVFSSGRPQQLNYIKQSCATYDPRLGGRADRSGAKLGWTEYLILILVCVVGPIE